MDDHKVEQTIQFGYKLSFFIVLVFIISVIIIPYLLNSVGIQSTLAHSVVGGALSGFGLVTLQYSSKKVERTASYWTVGCLLTLLFSFMLFVLYSFNIVF